MKSIQVFLLVLLCSFLGVDVHSQNVSINILTRNSGMVKKGKTVFLELTINNTDPATHVGVYKIRAQVHVPSEIVSIDNTGHILPTGWTILSNDGSVIDLSNGKDMIASSDARTILIALRGNKTGGP